MNHQHPDRITIESVTETEVSPKHALLKVVVEGESSVFGNEAFKKSKEIALLISELDKIGYFKESITLESISFQTSTGKLLKASSARFNLLLDTISVDLMPRILGLLACQKNIEITAMNYEFGHLEIEKQQLLQDGSLKAKQQAQAVCSTLGVALLGIYSMSQMWTSPNKDGLLQNQAAKVLRMSRASSVQPPELNGLDFVTNHKSKLILTLNFEFRAGEFKS